MCGYKDSLQDGKYTKFYPNGIHMVEGTYVKGMYNGKWFWYDNEGLVVSIGDFTAGAGSEKVYNGSGKLIQVIRFKDNLKEGAEEFYDSEGRITEIRYYRKGELTGEKNPKK